MNVAVNVTDIMESVDDLDLEDDEDFKGRLRSWCGLFVLVHQGNIYFLHQTAREFLLADSKSTANTLSELHWHHSITDSHAHGVLASICVLYLNLLNSHLSLAVISDTKDSRCAFLRYSAKSWAAHFRQAGVTDGATILHFARRICDTALKGFMVWFEIFVGSRDRGPYRPTNLIIASYMGILVLVKQLLTEGAEIDERDGDHILSLTSLSWASRQGHKSVVKLLLEKGADINDSKRIWGETPLYIAVIEGHYAVVDLLLEEGADLNAKNGMNGDTAFSAALMHEKRSIMQLLLRTEAKLNNGANLNFSSGS